MTATIYFDPCTAGVGERLQLARERAGLTIDDVSRITGFDPELIREDESADTLAGSFHLDYPEAIILATLYGVSLESLAYSPAELARIRKLVADRK
jgi:hypothetical protein